ncbi:nucleotidyltransferase domain-containing protein [Sediminibacillus massiliensis]|uniref:nucleotidyltransferase domain-containing protein n=1 Tax=Sediminibacillus massiliensis TaxID=1926277 RepID=UPI0009884496|nr:nucleotidyltransferase family protein [Sediminibacillus massiliensis]
METTFHLDKADIPKELMLIINIIKDKKDHLDSRILTDINWDLFIEQVNHHRLYPTLYRRLKRLKKGIIPEYVMKSIEQQYKRNTFQMLQLSAEMEQISKLFSKADILTIFLKGPMLAHELYGDVSLRTSSDLDLLIPIDQLEKADRLLTDLGYEKDDYIQTVLNDWKWRHHHVTYIHPKKRMKLEIHWRLNPGPSLEPSFRQLWERKSKCNLTSYPVYLLGKEDLFLLLVSHGARHGWSRLRWLLDIDRLVQQGLDWKKTCNLIKRYGYLQTGGQAVILANDLLNTKVSKEVRDLLQNKYSQKLAQEAVFYLETMINLHTEPLPEKVSNYHKQHLFALMSVRQKIFFILSFLFPYPEDADTLPLPKKLHFLYFPLRPFLWAWRKTRKQALS